MSNKKTSWSNIKLRAQLFRIWFMKNILVWLQIFLIVCVVLILTGNLTQNTPILGFLIYPIFKPLVDEILALVQSKEITGLMDFCAVSISVLTSTGLALVKVRSIAQSDIKSKTLKLALVKANLYFNENGKLVKKTEAMVGYDLDGDGIIEGNPEVTKGLFSGLKTAAEEFKIIATTDFTGNDKEDAENYEQALKDAKLETSSKALGEIDEIVKDGVSNFLLDETTKELNKRIEKAEEEGDAEKISLLEKTKQLFKKIFTRAKKEETKEDDAEIIVNNVDDHAVVNGRVREKEEKKIEATITESKIMAAASAPQQKPVSNVNNDIASFLSQFK